MTTSLRIRPWQAQPNDVILGTGMIITGKAHYSEGDIGSDNERQLYTLPLQHGDTAKSITYNAEAWLTVIRKDS